MATGRSFRYLTSKIFTRNQSEPDAGFPLDNYFFSLFVLFKGIAQNKIFMIYTILDYFFSLTSLMSLKISEVKLLNMLEILAKEII